MKFCMITTFFGRHSFGGDAAYVDRLSRALLRRGHSVDVICNISAFEAVRGDHPLRSYEPPPGLELHGLRSAAGLAGIVWMHQTGRCDPLRSRVEAILQAGDFDVLHFHNISLFGLDVLGAGPGKSREPIRFLSAHEHWLTCPLSLLWKDGREPCEEPSCFRCTFRAGRPPQLWRSLESTNLQLSKLDALIVPSRHSLQAHRQRGIIHPFERLPYFLPDESFASAERAAPWPRTTDRPYFVAAGRLVEEKGFDEAIRQMSALPGADLLIAGTGPQERALKALAAKSSNVFFTGLLGERELWSLYKGARAVIVPSRFYETFGYVVLEAMACGTPAIVRNRGALPELIEQSGVGSVFETPDELAALLRRYLDGSFALDMRQRAVSVSRALWSEKEHLDRYFELIEASGSATGRRARQISTNC